MALLIAWLVIYLIGKCKLYQKAGRKAWEAIVPFYNNWVLVEISGLAWWWFLLLIAPTIMGVIDEDLSTIGTIATIIGNFACYYNISKKLHKDTSFAILTTIFQGIMVPIIGLSKEYQFDNSIKVDELGPFKNNNNTKINTSKKTDDEKKYCPNCGTETKEKVEYCKNCGTKLK